MAQENLHTTVETCAVDSLIPYANNPKEHPSEQVEKIASSIKNYGWDQPIVVDESNEIIKGHGRLEAAKLLNLEEVPIIKRTDLSDAEKRAARIADNKTAESEWSDDDLALELEQLDEDEFDLDLTGFDDEEIDDILDSGTAENSVDYEEGSLESDFGVPPFSVLNTTRTYWKERKAQWIDMGLDTLTETPAREDAVAYEGMQGDWDAGKDSGGIGGGVDSHGVSVFDPVLAELLYRWFAPDNAIILDPFAGGPARAVVAGVLGGDYYGIDLNYDQITHNRDTWTNLKDAGLDATYEPTWSEGTSENMDKHTDNFGHDSFDLLFSCPPYHDLEEYTDQEQDLSNMSYDEFIDSYNSIIKQGVDKLKDNRFAAFVVSEVRDNDGYYRGLVSDTVQAFESAGMSLYNDAVLVNSPGTLPARVRKYFERGRKLGRMHQNVLVFYKGDPSPDAIHSELGDVDVPEDIYSEDTN